MKETHISGRGIGAVSGSFSLIKSFYAKWLEKPNRGYYGIRKMWDAEDKIKAAS